MKLGTETVDMFWLAQMRREHAEFARQRDVLAGAIHQAALEAGIINGEVPLDGPQLLMVLDDLARNCVRLQAAAKTLGNLGYTDNGGELWKPPLGKKPDFGQIDQLRADNEALRKNSDRYVWLRDKSEPFNPFYISVPVWLDGVKFSPETVDEGIDKAMELDAAVRAAASPDEVGKP